MLNIGIKQGLIRPLTTSSLTLHWLLNDRIRLG